MNSSLALKTIEVLKRPGEDTGGGGQEGTSRDTLAGKDGNRVAGCDR